MFNSSDNFVIFIDTIFYVQNLVTPNVFLSFLLNPQS